jgi:hypothetical protein
MWEKHDWQDILENKHNWQQIIVEKMIGSTFWEKT